MKHGKYSLAKFCTYLYYIFVLREEKVTIFELKLSQDSALTFGNSPFVETFDVSGHFHFGNVRIAIVGARKLNDPP
mgnify:CR=1 FL=1